MEVESPVEANEINHVTNHSRGHCCEPVHADGMRFNGAERILIPPRGERLQFTGVSEEWHVAGTGGAFSRARRLNLCDSLRDGQQINGSRFFRPVARTIAAPFSLTGLAVGGGVVFMRPDVLES